MSFGVFVFAIDGGGESFYRIAVGHSQIFVELSVLIRTPFKLGEHIPLGDRTADVAAHGTDDFLVVTRVRLAGRLFAEKYDTDRFIADHKRQQ